MVLATTLHLFLRGSRASTLSRGNRASILSRGYRASTLGMSRGSTLAQWKKQGCRDCPQQGAWGLLGLHRPFSHG